MTQQMNGLRRVPTPPQSLNQPYAPTGTADDALEFWAACQQSGMPDGLPEHMDIPETMFTTPHPVHVHCTPVAQAAIFDTARTLEIPNDPVLTLPTTGSLVFVELVPMPMSDEIANQLDDAERPMTCGYTWMHDETTATCMAWTNYSGHMMVVGLDTYTYGTPLTEDVPFLKFLHALDLWVNTTAIREPSHATRAARRRYKRTTGNTPTETIKLKLRHLEHQEHQGGTHAAATHDHRWIVQPHWRNQPCGPGRTEIRRVRVAPYIKGPVDAPLKIRDRIWKLDR